MIYVNHAGTSWPKPPEVIHAVRDALDASPLDALALFESARSEICALLGIEDPERFLFTPGCTAALAVAIVDLPWQEGDVVITSALEHHALARPVEQLVTSRGVRHVISPYAPGRPLDLDFVRETLRGGRVRLVAVTHASNVTGELLPVEELAPIVHEHGGLLLVDAAQTVGVVPLDVRALGADILAFAGHKGAFGPQGIGGLWASARAVFQSPQASCEVGSGPCAPFPSYCDVGSVHLAGAVGLAAGLAWRRRQEQDHARELAVHLIEALGDVPGVRVFAPDAPRTSTLSLTIDGMPPERAESFFHESGVVLRAGRHCAPMALVAIGSPAGTIRISFGPAHTREEVESVTNAILRSRGAS